MNKEKRNTSYICNINSAFGEPYELNYKTIRFLFISLSAKKAKNEDQKYWEIW